MKIISLIILFFTAQAMGVVVVEKTTFTAFDGVQLSAKVYHPDNNSTDRTKVLIIEGSGKSGFTVEPEGSPFSELAKSLAANGMTVLKYNKRGSGENANNGSFWKATFTSDHQDAKAALKLLRSLDPDDSTKIILIGHSFGGPQSLLLASNEKVSGVIMLTSTIRPTDQLILEQNAVIMGLQGMTQNEIDSYLQTLKTDLAQIKANTYSCQLPSCSVIDDVSAYENSIQVPWLHEVLNMNYANLARSVSSRLLFIFGTSDAIIPESDYNFVQNNFKNITQDVEIKLIPKLDHFMVENESKLDSLQYAAKVQKEKIFKPVSPALIETILLWINQK